VESTLAAEYFRAMRFLYEKEFLSKRFEGDRRRAEVAELYQTRGLSTDSRADAGFAVWKALAFLKQESPATRLDRVLIVGPGLDSAPRTDLTDLPPESSQPFAVADAILQLGLSTPSIHCVDISPHVVGFLQEFSTRPQARVTFLSRRGTSEYQDYFRNIGNAIGREVPPNPLWKLPASIQARTVEVQRGVARRITASHMNILTETGDPRFDLVVATNVFVYFDRPELLLALASIHSLLRDGGYLIHNEIRDDVDGFSRDLAMPPVDARRIPLFENEQRVLLDGFVLHRKESR
jgi:SAM-dependent methyltransferase